MPEYDLSFAKKLADTAALVAGAGLGALDVKRTVLHLGRFQVRAVRRAIEESKS